MGNVSTLSVHPKQPSISCPGELSAITDPISKDLIDDVHEFFSELIETVKDPIGHDFVEQYFVKDVRLDCRTPDEFTCEVTLDGSKMKRLMPTKPDESDVCRSCIDCSADRAKLYMRTTERSPADTSVKTSELHSMFHVDEKDKSVRCEIWGMSPQGERKAGKLIAKLAEWVYVKPLLLCRAGQKVKVHSGIDSGLTGGRSVMTDPLDAFFTAETFHDALVQVFEKGTFEDAKGEVRYTSEREFEGCWEKDFKLPKEMVSKEAGKKTGRVSAKRSVVANSDSLQVSIHEYVLDELVMSSFYKTHRDPVRCEFWQEALPSGQRRGGGKQAMVLRLLLLKLISEAEVREQIKELWEDNASYMF